MRRPLELVALLAGVALLIGLSLARDRAMHAAPPSVYSTYDTGPNGYRALYDALAAHGVAVSRSERELALLDPHVRTLVETSVAPELAAPAGLARVHPLDDHDVAVMRAFLRRGGRLVVIAADIGGEEDALLGLPGASAAKGARDAAPIAGGPYVAGVRVVSAPLAALFPLAIPKATPLIGTSRGTVAIAYPYGAGEVVAISAPALFANAHVAAADNARFAFDLLGGAGPVAFDERVHGYVEDRSFWAALPEPVRWAFWIVAGIVALALVGANVRFAPPIPLEPPDERDSSAYVAAMAALMRRARAARAAIATFADDARRRARRHGALAPEVQAALLELERLTAITNPGEAALVRAAALDARLRKDFP